MQSDSTNTGPDNSGCGGETEFFYIVGYTWNGEPFKEMRIRHLARKFLKIWMQKTYGRIPPHKAKSHYNSVLLRRAFVEWKEEWWSSRREWSLHLQAECHYRYHLYHLAFHCWRLFMSLQAENKSKITQAQSSADRQQVCRAWNQWEVFTEMRRMKIRMLESALEQKKLTSLQSAWSLWQTRLQQHQHTCTLEDGVLRHRAVNLQRGALLQWTEMHSAACCQREKESSVSRHFITTLKRKTLRQWGSYVSHRRAKKSSQAVAVAADRRHLMRTSWRMWSSMLQCLQDRACIQIPSREEAERIQTASRHYHCHLMRAALHGLSLNVLWSKAHRLNNNVALQHWHQTMMSRYWSLWRDCLEEAEDQSIQPLQETSLTDSVCVWSDGFQQQREEQLQHTWTESEQTERALWHWSLSLQAKVLYGWRQLVMEQRRRRVYGEQSPWEGVTYILMCTDPVTQQGTNLSSHEQRAVKRCAMRWKQRALCKQQQEQGVRGQRPKKNVTFCLPDLKRISSDSVEQEAEGGVLEQQLPARSPRRQPIRFQESDKGFRLFDENSTSSQKYTEAPPHHSELSCPPLKDTVSWTWTHQSAIVPPVSPPGVNMSVCDLQQTTQSQELLLPPSTFIPSSSKSADAPVLVEMSSDLSIKETERDPTSSLTQQLLSILQDLRSFQQDKKRVKAWRGLKEALQTWLRTTGKEDQFERGSVCEALEELEEQINRLSTQLAAQTPKMLLQIERIQRLQTALHTLGVPGLRQQVELDGRDLSGKGTCSVLGTP